MKQNIGKKDRYTRLAIAIALLLYAGWAWSWVALLASLFVFYEAIAGWCALFQLLGKNSCPIRKEDSGKGK